MPWAQFVGNCEIALIGRGKPQRREEEDDDDLGRQRRREPENARICAGVDDEHDEDRGDRLAHRPGERREAAGSHDPLPVALDRVGEEGLFLGGASEVRTRRIPASRSVASAASSPRSSARARECRRIRLVSIRRPIASGGTTTRLNSVRRTEMLARMNSVVAEQEQVPDQRHHRRGDDALRLVGLVDERRHQQAGPGAVEEAEVELQQVIVELASQARDQSLLHAGVELRRERTRRGS